MLSTSDIVNTAYMIRFLGICAMCLWGACVNSQDTSGGIEGGNTVATISGNITDSVSAPLANVRVRLLASSYNPVNGPAVPDSLIDTTDSAGRYTISVAETGGYTIDAVGIENGLRSLIAGVSVSRVDTEFVHDAVARRPGTVQLPVPADADLSKGYFYIPGTTIYSLLTPGSRTVELDSIPPDVDLSIYYAVRGDSAQPELLRDSVVVASGRVVNIEYMDWKYSAMLVINTGVSGANVVGTVVGFPVLVRLTNANFTFSEAATGGSDLRFTKSDGSPLVYEIERWDAAAQAAEIWVKMDTVYGNNSVQFITMYWGASTGSTTASLSNSAAVFDTVNGFQGVWHLQEPDFAIVKDATGNRFDGTPSDTAPVIADGIIGKCKRFNGSSGFIRMYNTASGKLNFPEKGVYSLSAWVYADTLNGGFHSIVGKGDNHYFLKLKEYYPPNPMRWEFVEYHDKAGWEMTDYVATPKTWVHLVGVRNGEAQQFFVNGEQVDASTEIKADTLSRNTGDDLTIGKFLTFSKINSGYAPYKGKIDEVRISNIALHSDWIRLCYMNQKEPDRLVEFK